MTDLVQRLRNLDSDQFDSYVIELTEDAACRIEQLETTLAQEAKARENVSAMRRELERENAELRKDSTRMQWIVGNEIDAFILLQTTSGTFIRAAIDEAMK